MWELIREGKSPSHLSPCAELLLKRLLRPSEPPTAVPWKPKPA